MKHGIPLILVAITGIAVSGCAHVKQIPVTVETTHEVKVPVSSPCVKDRPDEVVALNQKMTREEFASLTTDQREKLLGAQALDRRAYGDKLNVSTAGCR